MRDRAINVGVLCVQGSFAEHISKLKSLGASVTEVRVPAQMDTIDAIVLPGGESTTFLKLIDLYQLREPMVRAIRGGLPVLATCAGVVILASRISSHSMKPLGVLDIELARNAFGRQVDSFEEDVNIEGMAGPPFRGVFIRAPIIRACGPSAEVLARLKDGTIVACRQNRITAMSFHPEFVPDMRVHEDFLRRVDSARRERGSSTT